MNLKFTISLVVQHGGVVQPGRPTTADICNSSKQIGQKIGMMLVGGNCMI
jgi:hypothetical protein